LTDITSTATASAPSRRTRFRLAALAGLVIVVGIILWLALRDTGSSSSKGNTTAVSAADIAAMAAEVGHPIYWLGPRSGETYELTKESNGAIFIRYLPKGEKLGSKAPYLSVGTYPFPGAYSAIKTVSGQRGSTPVQLAGGGLGVVSSSHPESVHLAYPGVDYQVEVFDPTPSAAATLVAGGKLVAVGKLKSASPTAKATSAAGLKALAKSVGHDVYWDGPKRGYTYEVSQGSAGQTYLRYLPSGVPVGSSSPYLTVATYSFQNAFQAMKALSKQKNADVINLAGGGIAVVDRQHPTSIHLAYPHANVQVEVFDPSAAAARSAVFSGRVQPIR
jgi:hypothetical protein